MSSITSGRIKKAEKKYVYNRAHLGNALPEIQGGIEKKSCSKTVKYPKVHHTVSTMQQTFKILRYCCQYLLKVKNKF